MAHHAVMERADRIAAAGQAQPRKKTVNEAGKRADQHPGAEAEGHAHMLKVGLIDRGGMFGEAADHEENCTGRGRKQLATFAPVPPKLSM